MTGRKINSKDKGRTWESDARDLLNTHYPGTWKKIPMSGALGTTLNIPSLKGDLAGKYRFMPHGMLGEAKCGYGGAEMKVRKEWFDKINLEASESNSMPVVLLKFSGARSGVKHVIAMDFETWDSFMSEMESMYDELTKLYEKSADL